MKRLIFTLILIVLFIIPFFPIPWRLTDIGCYGIRITGIAMSGGLHVSIIDPFSGQWLLSKDYPLDYFASGANLDLFQARTTAFEIYVYRWLNGDDTTPVSY